MKITYKEFRYKTKLKQSLLNDEEAAPGVQSKIKYALQKSDKLSQDWISPINDKMMEIGKKYATLIPLKSNPSIMVFANGEKGEFLYTPENQKLLDAEMKTLDEIELEFEPYIFSDEERISQVDDFIAEELRGFFFPLKSE